MVGINFTDDLGSLFPITDDVISSPEHFSPIHFPPSTTQSDIVKDSVGPMMISDKEETCDMAKLALNVNVECDNNDMIVSNVLNSIDMGLYQMGQIGPHESYMLETLED